MRIASHLNTTPEEIAARSHNIYIGISLGNKYFTREHVTEFIRWAVANTKEKVVVLLADKIHAINLEVFGEFSAAKSVTEALRCGDQMVSMIREIMAELSPADRDRVAVVRWNEIEQEKTYQERLAIITNEWNTNAEFHEFISDIFRAYVKSRGRTLTPGRIERGCEYILRELPTFFGGPEFQGVTYTLHPYPGLTEIDKLSIGVQEGAMFPGLGNKLCLKEKIAILEAYAE